MGRWCRQPVIYEWGECSVYCSEWVSAGWLIVVVRGDDCSVIST